MGKVIRQLRSVVLWSSVFDRENYSPIILVLLLQFVLNQMPFNIVTVECLNLDIYMNIFLGVGSLLNWK